MLRVGGKELDPEDKLAKDVSSCVQSLSVFKGC